jgi:hypothetical protein
MGVDASDDITIGASFFQLGELHAVGPEKCSSLLLIINGYVRCAVIASDPPDRDVLRFKLPQHSPIFQDS